MFVAYRSAPVDWVAMMVDPSGATHPDGYTPDQAVDPDGEALVEAARSWLGALPACD